MWAAGARDLLLVVGGPCAFGAMLEFRLHGLCESDDLRQIWVFPIPRPGPLIWIVLLVSGLMSHDSGQDLRVRRVQLQAAGRAFRNMIVRRPKW